MGGQRFESSQHDVPERRIRIGERGFGNGLVVMGNSEMQPAAVDMSGELLNVLRRDRRS